MYDIIKNIMEMPRFKKNDSGFICEYCGFKVEPLGYTSRAHCSICLSSLHIDINPGDRLNPCKGLLIPIEVNQSNKKGYIIKYKCSKCHQYINNKASIDDDFETLLSVMNCTYERRLTILKNKTTSKDKNINF